MDNVTYSKITKAIAKGIGRAAAVSGAHIPVHEAEDISQDVLVAFVRVFDPTKGDPGALAFTSAYNATLDILRARKPQARAPRNRQGEVLDVDCWDAYAHQESSRFLAPDEALFAKERAAQLLQAAEDEGVAGDLADLVSGDADLGDGAVRVKKHRIAKKLAGRIKQ